MFSSMFKPVGKTLPGHPAFYAGAVAGSRVVFGTSGVGKTNAAHAATVLLGRFSPSCIVNFGIGGAYPSSGLKVGDIAVAEKEVYADEGVLLKDGLHSFEITGIPLLKVRGRKYFNEFPADKRLSRLALKAAGDNRSLQVRCVSDCFGLYRDKKTGRRTCREIQSHLRKHGRSSCCPYLPYLWNSFCRDTGDQQYRRGPRYEKMGHRTGCRELPEGGIAIS